MSTKTSSTFNAKFMDLPIVKTLGENQIVTKVDNFRKGEKGLNYFLRAGVYGAIGYGIWTYVLPVAFVALGQLIALAITAALALFLFFAAPAIFSLIKILARNLHKAVIKFKPFEQLAKERQKYVDNQIQFRTAQQGIKVIQNDMADSADKMKLAAENANADTFRLQGKAENLRAEMKAITDKLGPKGKEEDEYVNLAVKLQKVLADSQLVLDRERNSKIFMDKYKAREMVMKKLSQTLVMVGGQMEIKIAQFDQTVEFLKADYDFAQKSNAATTAARNTIGFDSNWERDYAIECVIESISLDTAATSGNLRDIQSLTSNYNLDSDELYANLEKATQRLSIDDGITDFNKYKNPDYVMTDKDNRNAGGLGDMFN